MTSVCAASDSTFFNPTSSVNPRSLVMSRILALLIAGLTAALPLAAKAETGDRAADLRYCAQLSELYVRYVGRSEAGPTAPVRPDVNAGVALAKCKEGDAAAAIPILERKLVNAGFTLPRRG
jgi:hypothetical protein